MSVLHDLLTELNALVNPAPPVETPPADAPTDLPPAETPPADVPAESAPAEETPVETSAE